MTKPICIFILATILLATHCAIHTANRRKSQDAYVYGLSEGTRSSYLDVPMFECAWCHRRKNLNRHHIIPQSTHAVSVNDTNNIVVLCRDCHFVLGHRCNWNKFNPDVMEIVNHYTNSIASKEYEPLQPPTPGQ